MSGTGSDTGDVVAAVQHLRAHPTSIVIWGSPREAVVGATLGLARRVDPEFHWFDIRGAGDHPEEAEARRLGSIPGDRFTLVDRDDVAPDHAVANLAGWVGGSPPSRETQFTLLAEAMRLPPALRQAIVRRDASMPPAVLVLANTERARAGYYGDRGSLTPYFRLLRSFAISPILTAGGTPRANAEDADVVFEVVPEPSTGTGPHLRCRHGMDSARLGILRVGSDFPLRVLDRSEAPPGV